MSYSSIRLCSYLLCLISFGLISHAATVTYDFNITWVTANPDGQFDRPTIGINGKWPIPQITATKGDRVIVNVLNQLGNQSTSLHFHGLFQNGTTHMDGAVGVSQCSIRPGASFTYNFTVDQPGTYWYHSHDSGQYPDGLRGPLVVHDFENPYKNQFDEELVLTVSDWYHDQMAPLLKKFLNVENPTGAEPIPDSNLFNDTQNLKVAVQPGKTYFIRIINIGAFIGQYVWFEGHTMRIVEVDGVYTEPAEASVIYMTAAQRYSILLTTKNDTKSNFAFVGSGDQAMFDVVPKDRDSNVTGWLVYDEKKELPKAKILESYDPFDDFKLVPQDKMKLLDKVDYSFNLDVKMDNLGDGANYGFFNNNTYVRPKVPTVFTALTTGPSAANADIYGVNTNAFILNRNDVVEIVLNSNDPGKHPFHLHGHEFQVVARSPEGAGIYNGTGGLGSVAPPAVPMRRDTVMVNPNGHFVIRFRANNPDMSRSPEGLRIWLFHCHIEWHVKSGLIATMIEAPIDLQKTLKIPEDHMKACRDAGVPTAGNAAGNTLDLLDLKGANVSPAPLPDGFTPRGIVALVFSTLCAFIGLAVISWYGLSGESPLKRPQ